MCEVLAPLNAVQALSAMSSSSEPMMLDLGGLEDLSASALAVLVASLRAVRATGLCDPLADFTPPRDAKLHKWLAPASLCELLDHSGDGRADTDKGRCPSGFCGCEPFSNQDGIVGASAALLTWLSEQIALPGEAYRAIAAMLWDLTNNVLLHADIDEGVAAIGLDAGGGTLEVAVADRGIGIRRSLARNLQYSDIADDSDAVVTALGPGVTSEPGASKGMGLYIAKLILAANDGTLTIRSGTARIAEPSHAMDIGPLPYFQGTLVTAVARLDRSLDLDIVNRQLQDPGGVFS